MRKILLLLIISAGHTAIASPTPDLRSLLRELDATIRQKPVYTQHKQEHIDSLKSALTFAGTYDERINIAQRLCFQYITFRTDSALVYVSRMEQYARRTGNHEKYWRAHIDRTRVLGSMGLLKEASDLLDEVEKARMTGRLHTEYIYCRLSIYNAMRDFALDGEERERYVTLSKIYRDSLLSDPGFSSINRVFVEAEELLYQHRYDQAIEELKTRYDQLAPWSRQAGIIAFSIAQAYRNKNEQANEMVWFALSAIADLRNAVREYSSLRQLAALMYESGDIDRAYNYMKCAMDDAILSNSRLMTIEASNMFLIIDKSYRRKELQQRRQIVGWFVVTALLAALLLLLYLRNRRQKLRLAAAKRSLTESFDKLREVNHILSDSNLIKEEYISLYMEQYADYLSKMNSFKARFTLLARKGNIESIRSALDTSLNPEEELREFYQTFDVTVLHLFPDFIREFNALLAPGEAITPRQGESLTPELRIFALIRLGITDSVKIAHFLQYSTSTIYNYRTKMRNKAAGNRDEFEGKVARIGLDK